MAQYFVDSSRQVRDSHRHLLIPPLLVALLFCFSFVLLQPNIQSEDQSASSKKTPIITKPKQKLSEADAAKAQPLEVVSTPPTTNNAAPSVSTPVSSAPSIQPSAPATSKAKVTPASSSTPAKTPTIINTLNSTTKKLLSR